ncbi:rap guanine nucleotide exchange factor 6-like [Sycon ciliatum]|uniref:rap guanine nucleotide exchange factor 6-like n=1 Tax=Sycon ciliatum TaxID=27933 RepID=UPI0031F71A9F
MEESESVDSDSGPKRATRQLPVMVAITHPPEKRTEEDIDTIMKSLEYAPVFLPLPPTVRRQLCASLHAKEVKTDEVIIEKGTELDFFYIMQGSVVEDGPASADGSTDESTSGEKNTAHSAGDSFGVPLMECSATEDRMISPSTFKAKTSSSLLWLNRDEVLRIAHPNTESVRRVEDVNGDLVAMTTYRAVGQGKFQQVVVRAAPHKLQEYLLGDEGGPQFIEDFLMTLPVFMKESEDLIEFLTNSIPEHVDRVASILSIWLRTQSDDFKERPGLRQGLEYIIQSLDSCPATPNTRFLQAVSKRLLNDEMDSLSIFSLTKSQSVTSTCSRESGGDLLEEEVPACAHVPITTGPEEALTVSSAAPTTINTPNAQLPTTHSSLTPQPSPGHGLAVAGQESGSFFRSPSTSSSRRSARFRRRTQSRMCGDKVPLKIFNSEGHYRIIPILDDYSCAQVLAMAVKAFVIDRPSEQFTLVNVSVAPPDIVKQRNIQSHMTKMSSYQKTSSRIYLKDISISGHVTSEDTTQEMIRNAEISLHTIDLKELVRHITMSDFCLFKKITPSDYIFDTFEMQSSLASERRMQDASDLVNAQMMWVVHEVCLEPDVARRAHVIRTFIELAVMFRRVRNFNSMLAIISGLSYTAVSRLKRTWERVPKKFITNLDEMQQLLDPSRNMANYRELLSSESIKPPFIPFFPIIKKDLTFLHLGNKTKVDGLINIDKLRMIASEVRKVVECTSRSYTGNDMLTGLPTLGSHLVTEQFEMNAMKKAHQYLMADQAITFYVKVFDNLDKDEKTLLQLSRELEPPDGSNTGIGTSRSESTTQIFAHKPGSFRRGQYSSLRKAFSKYISK